MNRGDALTMTRDLLDKHGLTALGWKPKFIQTKNILGQCSYRAKEIRLSAVYVDHNDADNVEQTILHEIAHALHGPCYKHGAEKPHGPRWQKIARSIGVRRAAASKKAAMPEPRWIATCPVCGKVIAKRHILVASARRFRSRCHSETVVWHDGQGQWAPKPIAPKPVMAVAEYHSMTPGQKAAYTKRMRKAAGR